VRGAADWIDAVRFLGLAYVVGVVVTGSLWTLLLIVGVPFSLGLVIGLPVALAAGSPSPRACGGIGFRAAAV
jgi:hypothetical protein